MSLRKTMAEDLEVAILRVKIGRAMRALDAEYRVENTLTDRKGELHVSDFTQREEQFCARSVVRRYLHGEGDRAPTMVQFDGKFREEKWRRLLERAGILTSCQTKVTRGRLVGHPDFIVELNDAPRIVELTGHDSKVPEGVRWERLAQKRRQTRLYQALSGHRDPAFIIVEDKGSNEFQVVKVHWDAAKVRVLLDRVALVCAALDAIGDGKDKALASRVVMKLGRCGKRRCKVCDAFPG